MQKQIITTADGSHTISIPQLRVSYHSFHGAIQESQHVFIEAGLNYVLKDGASQVALSENRQLNVLEMGFGTGLNSFLTAIEAEKKNFSVHYTAIEEFPLRVEEALELNYSAILGHQQLFDLLHRSRWNEDVLISEHFSMKKVHECLQHFLQKQTSHAMPPVDLIYYDAFAPSAQPELWTVEIFQKLIEVLRPGGALVTYCSKGDVKRAMKAAGFLVSKLPGPKGKREMVRAEHPL